MSVPPCRQLFSLASLKRAWDVNGQREPLFAGDGKDWRYAPQGSRPSNLAVGMLSRQAFSTLMQSATSRLNDRAMS